MAKTFREWDVQQQLLLPPSVLDFVPPGHLAHFVRDTVAEELDLAAIIRRPGPTILLTANLTVTVIFSVPTRVSPTRLTGTDS